ncbi:MAG: DUF167 domain-containing protein [Dehalococcoidales bacterium]|nr:DUF167 domain-containing protein [Dehalococcoidales bacterium]
MEQDTTAQKRYLSVHVSPSARCSEAIAFKDGVLYLKVAAPPSRGRANEALIGFLSARLGVRKSAVTIVKGHLSRDKIVAVSGMEPAEIITALGLSGGRP